MDIAKQISQGLADRAVIAKVSHTYGRVRLFCGALRVGYGYPSPVYSRVMSGYLFSRRVRGFGLKMRRLDRTPA